MSKTFEIFNQFAELKVGVFDKSDECTSDEECAKKLGFDNVTKLNQVHGDVTHIINDQSNETKDGDGLITNKSGIALSVRWADCQAFAIYAPDKKVLGALHAGWKGMAVKTITAYYKKLKEEFNIDPKDTYVGSVPSICKNCAEFTDPINELPAHLHPFINNKFVDLPSAADYELDSLDVPRNQRERMPACTYCDEGYWSWRRDNKEDARNYLVVGLS